jgi:hypothetical protein
VTIHRSISEDHPFFDECLQLYLLNLATLAIGLHVETQKDAHRFAEIANTLFSAFEARKEDKANEISVTFAGEWDLPDYPESICWQSLDSKEDCLLHLSPFLVDFARWGENKPTSLGFAIVPTTQLVSNGQIELPAAPKGLLTVDGAVPTTLFETVLAYLVGGSFERFKGHFRTKYGASSDWPPELQFFRHLRNGCFHRNQFRIDQHGGKDQIDPSNPPRWHSYVMPSDVAMNSRKVIGQEAFFAAPHLLLLLDDMSRFV